MEQLGPISLKRLAVIVACAFVLALDGVYVLSLFRPETEVLQLADAPHPDGVPVRVFVRGPDDSPLAGVEIRAGDELLGTTDGDGAFGERIPRDRAWAGQGLLTASTEGFEQASFGLYEGQLMLVPSGRVAGIVVASDGTPVPNARLVYWPGGQAPRFSGTYRDHGRRYPPSTQTAEDGTFLLEECLHGEGTLQVTALGFMPARSGRMPVSSDVDSLVLVRLSPNTEGPVERLIHVLRPDGTEHDDVTLYWMEERKRAVPRRISGESPLAITLQRGVSYWFEAHDRTQGLHAARIEGLEAHHAPVRLELGERKRLELWVVDTNGKPVPENQVSIDSLHEDLELPRQRDSKSLSGARHLDLPGVPFRLRVKARGFRPWSKDIHDPGSVSEGLTVALDDEGGVRGRVTRSGRPLAGAGVALADEWTTTDAEGGFRFYCTSTLRESLKVYTDSGQPYVFGPHDFEPRGSPLDLELELEAPGTIAGRIALGPYADPEQYVVAVSSDRHTPFQVRVDAGGSFRIGGLQPGTYEVSPIRLMTRGRAVEHWSPLLAPETIEGCAVVAGRTTTLHIDLTHEARLLGKIRFGDSVPSGVAMALAPVDPNQGGSGSNAICFTDAEGGFEFTRLAGEYELRMVPGLGGSGSCDGLRRSHSFRAVLDLESGLNLLEWTPPTGSALLRSTAEFEPRTSVTVRMLLRSESGVSYAAPQQLTAVMALSGHRIDDLPVGVYDVTIAVDTWSNRRERDQVLETVVQITEDEVVVIEFPDSASASER